MELMVAIGIFAVLGLGAHLMLRNVMDSNHRVRLSAQTYTDLNLAFATFGRDFRQYLPRGVRDNYGDAIEPLVFGGDTYVVEFTRTGWPNPRGTLRSALQRVAYAMDHDSGTLTRHFWQVLDRAEDSQPVSQVLLTGVTDFQVKPLLPPNAEAQAADQAASAPIAMQLVLATESQGEMTRVFQLPASFTPAREPSDADS